MIIGTLPVSKQKEFISHLILGKYLTEIYIGLLFPWSVVLSRYCGFLHH
jgi:hypothetical protein